MTRPIVEIAFGYGLTTPGPVLTDVTQYVDLARGISITRGAQDELSETQPGTCTLTLDNTDGRFSPDRPSSPYYPNVKKAVPIRVAAVSMDTRSGAGPWPLSQLADDFDDGRLDPVLWVNSYGGASETGGRGRVPCSPGLFAGLQSVRNFQLPSAQVTVRVATLPALNGSSAGTGSAYLNSTTSGTRLGFQYNAATGNIRCVNDVGFSDGSAVSVAFSWSTTRWWRIREAAGTVFWETSGDGSTWNVRRSLATPAWASSQLLTFSMDTSRTGGTGDFYEIDMVGATVHPRFFGLINEWPVDWKGLQSTVTITATDLLTWASINKQLAPMLVQEVLLDRPTVYFPLTEPSESTSAGSVAGTASVGALAITQVGSGGTLEFGAGTGPNGLPAPVFTPVSTSVGKYLSADLGQTFVDANLSFRVRAELWFSTSTNGRVLMGLRSDDSATKMVILLESGTGKLALDKDQGAQGNQSYVFATPNLADGNLHHLVYNEFENLLYIDGVSYSLSAFNGTDLRHLTVGGYQNTRLWNGTIAHVAVYCRSVTAAELSGHYVTGTTGHAGEGADDRLTRLATYAGLGVQFQGSVFDAVAAQATLGSSALQHLREIETTESGKLLTTRTNGPLLFQSRDLRYNPTPALTLAYEDCETDGVRYAYDDQKMVNTVTASRPGGATQRVVNQTSADLYGEKTRDLNLFKDSDNATLDAANWLVSRYSEPVAEVRQVPVEAYSMPLATYRSLLDADVSTVLSLTGLPSQAPTSATTLFVEGYSERIGQSQHHLDFHTSRAGTDSVWVLDDPTYSVLDSTTRLAY
ncbi:LamG-like jellyroll fold domain-containing protein [Streptomyces cadmiisoli]|uniref:LamG-like jellyroll fold domain-containing protein n=1 Tax=Streptomyces cadmiisoli TaxID=2184053 RepID=UPI00365B683E